MSPFHDRISNEASDLASGQVIGAAFIRHLSLFGDLNENDRQALLGIKGRIGIVQRGEAILHVGDKPDHVVVVLSGMLRRYGIDSDGNYQIHSFYLADDVPSLEGLHIDVMDNTLEAVTTSKVALVLHSDMLALLAAHPHLTALCWRETLVQASIFREWLARNSHKLAHARTAHLFCEMMTRAVAAEVSDGKTMYLPLKQQDLAEALGLSAVHVSRTLGMLRDSGFITFSRRTLTIHNFSGLAAVAGFNPTYLHLPTKLATSG